VAQDPSSHGRRADRRSTSRRDVAPRHLPDRPLIYRTGQVSPCLLRRRDKAGFPTISLWLGEKLGRLSANDDANAKIHQKDRANRRTAECSPDRVPVITPRACIRRHRMRQDHGTRYQFVGAQRIGTAGTGATRRPCRGGSNPATAGASATAATPANATQPLKGSPDHAGRRSAIPVPDEFLCGERSKNRLASQRQPRHPGRLSLRANTSLDSAALFLPAGVWQAHSPKFQRRAFDTLSASRSGGRRLTLSTLC